MYILLMIGEGTDITKHGLPVSTVPTKRSTPESSGQVNAYVTCRAQWLKDDTSSDVSWTTNSPRFNYSQVCYTNFTSARGKADIEQQPKEPFFIIFFSKSREICTSYSSMKRGTE